MVTTGYHWLPLVTTCRGQRGSLTGLLQSTVDGYHFLPPVDVSADMAFGALQGRKPAIWTYLDGYHWIPLDTTG